MLKNDITALEMALSNMYDLKAIADRYINGIDTQTLNDNWTLPEHLAYSVAMNDAISILNDNVKDERQE